MSSIDSLLAANATFASSFRSEIEGPRPKRSIAVVTCIDTRIDPLAVFGVGLGEVVVLRNAGGRVTDDVLRSLAVATHVLDVEAVVLMQHIACGVLGVTDDDLRRRTGADLAFFTIDDHRTALDADIEMLASAPFLLGLSDIAGVVYDVESGEVEPVARWTRQAEGRRE